LEGVASLWRNGPRAASERTLNPPMSTPAPSDLTLQAAVDWFVRLQGDSDLETWIAFQAWLEADAANARAYDTVEALWVDIEEAPPSREPHVVAASDNVVPLAPRRAAKPPQRGLWIGGAIAAALAVTIALPALMKPGYQDYATAKGQIRKITLADGSKVTLGAATTLRVRLGKTQRDAVLVDGEAAFDVAHQPSRPFVVAAGDREIRVLGTEFNVLNHGDRLDVTVRRGLVAVSGDGQSVQVAKGQKLTHAKGAAISPIKAVDPEAEFAWSKGQLIYRDAPLSEVVADINRYVATPISVDPSAASVKFSGVLSIDEEAAMIRRLELFAPVVSQPGPGQIVLKAKTARP
jgi:transmembrane sensor